MVYFGKVPDGWLAAKCGYSDIQELKHAAEGREIFFYHQPNLLLVCTATFGQKEKYLLKKVSYLFVKIFEKIKLKITFSKKYLS